MELRKKENNQEDIFLSEVEIKKLDNILANYENHIIALTKAICELKRDLEDVKQRFEETAQN